VNPPPSPFFFAPVVSKFSLLVIAGTRSKPSRPAPSPLSPRGRGTG